jgi:hypothetical protein
MKCTVMGFSQKNLVKLRLDMVDATILRHFINSKKFKGSKVRRVDDKVYYLVRYSEFLKELPILNIKKCTVQSRFFKLRNAGILSHLVVREGGTYCYYGIGENYAQLISEESDEIPLNQM